MSCIQFKGHASRIGSKFLEILRLRRKPTQPAPEISAPFNFKEGPAINFPGYSEDDISLMREKAIASIAVVEDGKFDFNSRYPRPGSLASSAHGCGLGSRVVYHARRVSRGYLN